MKAYIICIILVSFLNIINEKVFLKKNEKIPLGSILLSIMSLFVLCFIAGVRNLNVGTDVNVYVTRLIDVINHSPNIITYLKNSNSDFLFALLVYIGYLSKNISVVLFTIELAVALPIYIYSYYERKNKSFTINILIFLLTMYCISFNLMRQSIAISICILSYLFFNRKNYKKSMLCLIIAIFFHKTSLVFIVALFINFFIKSNMKHKSIFVFLTILLMMFISIFMDNIVALTSYSDYLIRTDLMRNFSLGSILKKVFWVMLGMICLNIGKDTERNHNTTIAVIFAFISLILTITSFRIPGTGRLGYYFNNISHFLLIFEIPKAFKEKREVMFTLLIILTVLWWNMTAVDNDSSKVYPYCSDYVQFLN